MNTKTKETIECVVKSAVVGFSATRILMLIEGDKRNLKAYAIIGAFVALGFMASTMPKGFIFKTE